MKKIEHIKKVKVINICSKMHSSGGIQNILIRYFKNINKSKVQFDFLINSEENGDLDKEIINNDGKIFKVSTYYPNLLKNIIKKIKILKNNKYDIVHIHTTGCIMLIDAIVARVCGIKRIIFHTHIMNKDRKIYYKLCEKLFLVLGTDYWACSEESAVYFYGKEILQNNNYKIINNALNLNEYQIEDEKRLKIRKEFNVGDNLLVGFIGRLSEQKNIPFAIDVFKEVLKYNKNSKMIIVGAGELENSLKKHVKNMGLNKNIYFTGLRKDIFDVMQGVDVILMPSFYEGLPLVAIEAQALGKSILVSEQIPKEARITDTLHYMSLSNSDIEWANKVYELWQKGNNVNDSEKIRSQIKNSGYDIKIEAKKLESYYLNEMI